MAAEISTGLPTFKIFSDGSEINRSYGVTAISVTKQVNRISNARLVLLDGNVAQQNFELSAGAEFVPGNEIEIKVGYNNTEESIFKGIIIKHSIKSKMDKASLLILDIKDACVKLTVGKKSNYFKEITDSSIIEQIAGDYQGIDKDVQSTSLEHKEMAQYYCSDWDFILSRAEANGLLVFTEAGKISVKAPEISSDVKLPLTYGQNIIEFEAGMDARDQYAALKTKAWDYSTQELKEAEGEDPGLEETGNISGSGLSDVIGLEELPFQHPGKLAEGELQAWADSRLLRSRLAKIRGRVRIHGNASVNPGDTIELIGLGDRFNGKAFVSGVLHQVSANTNWFTDIEFGLSPEWLAERFDNIEDKPAAGLLPSIHGLHTGVVTKIHEDPDGEDRIKVRLPLINAEDEGIWARVACLDAGDKRGVFFRPELEDEVIVGFINDDPRYPVVLGMLNSSAKPAPLTAEEENNEKGFITRSEMKLLFNDDKKIITLETPGGNKLVLDDDDGSVLIEDKNGNKIKMSDEGITIESAKDINLKATGNVKVEGKDISASAQSNFVAEGNSSAEFKTSGKATIKGSMVGIN